MEEGNRALRRIEFYPSKGRFWVILIWGVIIVILGYKLFNMNVTDRILGDHMGFLIGIGIVVLFALIIEMESLPKKFRLKNLKKYIIMFLVLFIVSYGIRDFEPEIFIKIFGTFSVILGITGAGYSLYRLIIKRPSIILSNEGIRINSECNYYGIGIIHWDEIEEVFVYRYYLKRALGIKVYNMKELKKRQSFINKIISFCSGNVSILFSFFEGDNDSLEREIMRYIEEFKN